MSYARRIDTESEVYRNACRYITESKKYNGYSIVAGEYLLSSLRSRPLVRKKIVNDYDYWTALKDKYPADAWALNNRKFKSKYGRNAALRRSARRIWLLIENSSQSSIFLIFRGRKFKISNLAVGFNYVMAHISKEQWVSQPYKMNLYRQIREFGRAEFSYRGGEVIFEVVK